MDKSRFWVDGHVDWPYYLMQKRSSGDLAGIDIAPFSLQKAERAGIRLFGTALYCEDRFNGDGSEKHLGDLLAFTLQRLSGVSVVRKAQDLANLQSHGEGFGTFLILENADGLAGKPEPLDLLQREGMLLVGLTHMGRNRLAQGNGVEGAEGLTHAGQRLVAEIDRRGLGIDAAHLHPRCFWQLVDRFEGPLASSHTGIRELCDIRRNLDLRQAAEIMTRKGVVGVTCNPEMLTGNRFCALEDVFEHLDLLVQTFGPEGVAIGSDFLGFDSLCNGLQDIGQLAELARWMDDRGYGADAIQQIMGGNWLRFLSRLLGQL